MKLIVKDFAIQFLTGLNDMDRIILHERQVWARSGKQVVRKYRCSSGSRKGRVVSNVNQCYANPNMKKSAKLKLTKARMGKTLIRRSKKTKRVNPASKHLSVLNQPGRKIR